MRDSGLDISYALRAEAISQKRASLQTLLIMVLQWELMKI
jgi:ketol-acid reductoisomerase